MKYYSGCFIWIFFAITVLLPSRFFALAAENEARIDRQALVARHNLTSTNEPELLYPIGNGEFCFNVDATGLQTFCGGTFSHWGWHEAPLPAGFSPEDVSPTGTYQQGRNQGEDTLPADKQGLRTWLYGNPHQLNLARVRFVRADGTAIRPDEIGQEERVLTLWTGIHRSRFTLDGQTVSVVTAVGEKDEIAFRVESPLLAGQALNVALDFPWMGSKGGYLVGTDQRTGFAGEGWPGIFNEPDRHQTEVASRNTSSIVLSRHAVDRTFGVALTVQGGTIKGPGNPNPHELVLMPGKEATALEVNIRFGKEAVGTSDFATVCGQSEARWLDYWRTGGAVDLSGSEDPRATELERRIVLSQFQMRTNTAGSWPSPEPGLLAMDSWGNRFHMEMVWWHLAHYYLWGRESLATEAVDCYQRLLEPAEQLAGQLGYRGAMWPKAVGPNSRSQWWQWNLCLLWKQPHPFFFAELEYRIHPDRKTLEKWDRVLTGTADFMADYPTRDEQGLFHLDPVVPPCEQGGTRDTAFDLAYWRYGLSQAILWKKRLGEEPPTAWQTVLDHLAPLPVGEDDCYIHSPEWTNTYTDRNFEHPDVIGFFGMLPSGFGVDSDRAKRTVDKVASTWQWDRCWGWDFPWMAMAAAKAGKSELAVDMLLNNSPRNAYDRRGVNLGGPCPYLPGNGGLLYAVALMAAGWDGCPDGPTPGFPREGWHVRWEGLRRAP